MNVQYSNLFVILLYLVYHPEIVEGKGRSSSSRSSSHSSSSSHSHSNSAGSNTSSSSRGGLSGFFSSISHRNSENNVKSSGSGTSSASSNRYHPSHGETGSYSNQFNGYGNKYQSNFHTNEPHQYHTVSHPASSVFQPQSHGNVSNLQDSEVAKLFLL